MPPGFFDARREQGIAPRHTAGVIPRGQSHEGQGGLLKRISAEGLAEDRLCGGGIASAQRTKSLRCSAEMHQNPTQTLTGATLKTGIGRA